MSNRKVEALILDWAGTTVDYGCFAPLNVFLKVFRNRNIDITLEEARKPMGMLKIDHIRALSKMPRIAEEWKKIYGHYPDEEDVVNMYHEFEPSLLKILHDFADPIDGVVDTIRELRSDGLKIGSTTGYTKSMMDIIVPEAAKRGYSPDCFFTPDNLPGGRPYPWMCYENAIRLGVYPMAHVIKAGDTKADILEGINAGAWSIGIILGSSEFGLHKDEAALLSKDDLEKHIKETEEHFRSYGAHLVSVR